MIRLPEIPLSRMFKFNLHSKIEQVRKTITPIPEERKAKKEYAIVQMAKYIPEATLVGGWALRAHLAAKGMMVPDMPSMDIDFVIPPSDYSKVRGALAFPEESVNVEEPLSEERTKQIQDHFRRKGDKEPVPESMGGGYRSFMKEPENYMALEDATYKQHIDLDASDEEMSVIEVPLDSAIVKVLSPEDLLVRRAGQIIKYLNQEGKISQLPRKIYQYFYLNIDLIDEKKMEEAWQRAKNTGKWANELMSLTKQLDQGIDNKTIELVDVYH